MHLHTPGTHPPQAKIKTEQTRSHNQARVLEEARYGSRGEFVGLDVKAMRTQAGAPVTAHLANSREIFLHLVDKYRSLDQSLVAQFRDARDYEALELHLIRHLLGI
ncbi:MAG: hypothetical protein NTW21_35085 [Verrucomicrobia bacterium]|nr:hypothetical protein [Verrucomicrobiota bacterium]